MFFNYFNVFCLIWNFVLRSCKNWFRGKKDSFRRRLKWKLEEVCIVNTETGKVRWFYHTSIWYKWSSSRGFFHKSSFDIPPPSEMHEYYNRGGLTEGQSEVARLTYGRNIIDIKVDNIFRCLLNEFKAPIYIYQFAIFWLFFWYGTWNVAVFFIFMTLSSGSFRALYVVRRNQLKIQELAMQHGDVTILREGKWVSKDSDLIYPGDVFVVEEGICPVDCILLYGGAVANESALTGEPLPVSKSPVGFSESDLSEHDLHSKHFLCAGTTILQSNRGTCDVKEMEGSSERIDGCALALCVAVGGQSTRGNLVRTVMFPNPTRFQFGAELNRLYFRVSLLLLFFFILECILVNQGNAINLIYSGLLFLGFALNPNLPVAIVLAQSIRAIWLDKKGIACIATPRLPIAAKLHVMVFDKTGLKKGFSHIHHKSNKKINIFMSGTITKNGIDLLHVLPANENRFTELVDTDTSSYSWSKALPLSLQQAMGCCHNVTLLNDGSKVGNNVEISMVETSGWKLPSNTSRRKVCVPPIELNCGEVEILKVFEFDHIRMTSAVLIKDSSNTIKIIVKGSYERIASLSKSMPSDFDQVTKHYASEQYYVLAMGVKVLNGNEDYTKMSREQAEERLDFAGLLLFRNEIKPDSASAIEELRVANIRTVICTGDNALTALSVGRKCGMLPSSSTVNYDDNDNAPLLNNSKVDNINENVQIIIGDCNPNLTFHDEKDEPIPLESLLSSDPKLTEIILTASAFRQLCKDNDTITSLMPMIRIFSRMKPEDKVAVIRLLQERGLVVGMAGDGGNDCGALRRAHIGVALTDAEASLVSPFSTSRESLHSVCDIIKSGRSCLTTNVATTSWFIVYGLCYSISKLYFDTAVDLACPGEWQYFFTAIIVCMVFANMMVLGKPLKTLSPVRPSFRLFGLRSLLSVGIAMGFYFVMMIIGEVYLKTRGWYKTCNLLDIGLAPSKWAQRSNNYDSAFWVLTQITHLVFVGFMYSFGFKHRQSVFRNWLLLLFGSGVLVWVFMLAWGRPSKFSCLFSVNCDTETSMRTDVPFFKQFTMGSVGDCFLGPQLCDAEEKLGDNFQFPSNAGPEELQNKCVFDKRGNSATSFEKYEIEEGYFCIGPNNCWFFDMKLAFTLIVTIGCGLMVGCYVLMMRFTPGSKRHFGRY